MVARSSELVVDTICVRREVGVAHLLWLCTRGSRPLAFLDHVTFDRLVGGGTKTRRDSKGQTREGGKVACRNRFEPRAPDWVPSRSVVVEDKGLNRGKVLCTERFQCRLLLWVVFWEGRDGLKVRLEGDAPQLAPP